MISEILISYIILLVILTWGMEDTDGVQYKAEAKNTYSVILVDKLKTSLVRINKIIRELPNRDDKVNSQLKILDGGGVGRFEVLEIIKQVMGESLCNGDEKHE